nr:hypothetical protein [Tanacetum cinerariifolium]
MASLADKAILSGAENRPPMLEKDMYDSWRSRMEMYMLNRQHERIILESVEHGPLIWPSVTEEGVTRLKNYSELSAAEAIQADCDVKATNIILQALPLEIYALVSTHKVAKDLWERIQMLMQGTSLTKQERECKLYDAFDKVTIQPIQGRQNQMSAGSSRLFTSGSGGTSGRQRVIICYNCKDCDELKSSKVALMENLSHYGLDNLAEASTLYEYSQEIETLKHTLSEHLKEKESLTQKITLLKNDFQKEESRNIDRELALEKQRDTWSSQESAPTFAESFKINNLKAQAQAKDTVILKLKEKLNSLNGDVKDRDEKRNVEESETLNIDLGHQEKVLVITALKEQLDKLKGKAVSTEAVSLNTIDPKLLKVDVTPVVSKLRVNLASSASGLMSQVNTKNNRIRQTQKRAKKNKVEDHLRTVKSSLNKVSVVDSKATSSVLNSVSNVNSNLNYASSKLFKTVGHIWKPTGRTFTLVGNMCPLTRIATPTIVPPREPIPIVNKTDKPVVTLVYSRKPKSKNVSNKMEPNNSWGSSSSNVASSLSTCRLSKSSSVQTDEPNLSGTTIVEVPKELPKVSMVNSCLKRLKFHLASFDMVVKERTTAIAITEGTWGFEHIKACFRDDIIPFVKNLKELFTSFDQCLIDEVTEVQNFDCLNVDACAPCVTTESELKPDFIKKECYETLLQQYHILEAHCISLEVNNQFNTEIFQRDTVSSSESAPTFAELFKINDLKAQVQEKDTMILKLREKLNSFSGDVTERKVKREVEEIETLNLELDHKVTKLVAENEHLKQTYKQLYDSIKSSRVQSKEQCDDLINKVNLKSAKVSDLNVDVVPLVPKLRKNRTAHIDCIRHTQEEAATLRELVEKQLNKLKGKARKNRTAHTDYIRHTQEEAATLRKIVESEILLSPLNTSLVYACKYTRRIQELLMILQQTYPYLTDIGTKLAAVTPKNKTKQIRHTAQVTKSESITVTTLPSTNLESNKLVLSSTGVNLASSASGSLFQDNTKHNRIWQTQKKAKKNKVEDHLRTVKLSLNKAIVVDSKATSSVLNSVSNVNSNLQYASCNGCLLFDNHDACVVAYKNSVNAIKKSKSVKTPIKRKAWKTTGKVFKSIGHIWKPTG